jgi:preprotein translocase subunit SecG
MPFTDRLGALAVTQADSGTSFLDRLMIWLHVAFVIFTIGPVTIAILSSPRYIRTRNVAVLRYMLRTTRIFGTASLGVLGFGIAAAVALHKLSSPWVTAAMTLFVVSLVLIVLIMRDQRRAVVALETASKHEALAAAGPGAPAPAAAEDENGQQARAGTAVPRVPEGQEDAPDAQAIQVAPPGHAASVERGRMASMAGVVTLIWLVILVLMVWNT